MLKSKRTPILQPPSYEKEYTVTVDTESCDGCKLCVEFCVTDVLEIDMDTFNSHMLHYVVVVRPDDCVGCRQCERICPLVSIFISEENKPKEVISNES